MIPVRDRNAARVIMLAALAVLAVSRPTPAASVSSPAAPAHWAFSPPAGWREQADPGNHSMKFWLENNDRRPMISIVEDASSPSQVPESDDRKLIQGLHDGITASQAYTGITDWQVNKLERTRLPQGYRVTVTGSYLNFRLERIYFEEWKYYLPQGMSQIEYSELISSESRTRAQIRKLLGRYHRFGT